MILGYVESSIIAIYIYDLLHELLDSPFCGLALCGSEMYTRLAYPNNWCFDS